LILRDLPNLDFIRSVAVVSVVVDHTLKSVGITKIGQISIVYFGIMGVMIFFVHTTLVLMWSLERKPHTLDFYIRRAFRIYPLALAAIAITLLFRAPVSGTAEHYFYYEHTGLKDILTQASLVPNLFNDFHPLMSVMWSLPYEVEMYVLLPVLYFFIRKNFAVWPLLLIWIMTVSLAQGVNRDSHNFGVAIGYFLPGAMAYIGFERWRHRGWVVCLLLGFGLPLFKQIQAQWLVNASHTVAKYSYGIYLTHPFAIVIGIYLFRGHPLWIRLLAEAVPLIVLPVLAYHLLEHPMIRMGSRIAAKAEMRYELA
jgi:peptidoglycan/LPS O-acetylase OafA/YrhL